MPIPRLLRKTVPLILAATVALNSTSCGTLLYPERRGQPRGVIDPGVLLLDAVGLIFFVVPGIVAFVVDFSTGAIYLPPTYPLGPAGPLSQAGFRREDMVQVNLDKDELTQAKIEQAVSQRTGKPVSLAPGRFRASPMSDLDEFSDQDSKLNDSAQTTAPAMVRFSR